MHEARCCALIVYSECALTTFFPHWWIEDEAELDAWFEREMPYGKTIQPCSKTSVERVFGSFVGAILGRMTSVSRGELRGDIHANWSRAQRVTGFGSGNTLPRSQAAWR
jgi:hypothetical protein